MDDLMRTPKVLPIERVGRPVFLTGEGPQSSEPEVWYRYSEELKSSVFGGTTVQLVVTDYPVLKHTPAGVWLEVDGVKRFVRKVALRKFACATREDALSSFIARKAAQARVLTNQLKKAQTALTLARNLKEAEPASQDTD